MKQTILTLALLLLGISLSAQEENRWTAKDIIFRESLSGATFSPDGTRIAWVKSTPSEKKDRFVTDLWLTYLDQQDEDGNYRSVQLTRGDDRERSPVFSADGETLYFLSSKGGGKVLYALSLWGGAPYAVDSFKTSISGLDRLDEHTLIFETEEGATLYEQELKKKKDNVVVVEDTAHFKASRLFAYDLEKKKRRRLTDNRYPIGSFAFSRDAKWLVTSHVMSPHYPADGQPRPTYYLWDLENDTKTQILEGLQSPGDFQFTEDSKGFYFTNSRSSDPEWDGAGISLLNYYDLETNEYEEVDLDWDWGIGGGYAVRGNDAMVALANGTTHHWMIYRRESGSWANADIEADSLDDHFSLSALSLSGELALVNYSTASTPNQYHLIKVVNGRRSELIMESQGELVQLNKGLLKKEFARTESITWEGALGDQVTGMLYYPQGYEEGKTYKLMVAIHGGPSGVDMDRWSDRWAYPHNLITQEGCFILKPNYHGSSNHGQEFVESIKGHYYDLELPDIIAGIDSLVTAGLVNRDSMGVMGWSNGAILTTMLTVRHPEMFLAATPGAGDVNWTSDFGTCQFGVTFDQSYFIGAPWDDTDSTFYNPNYIIKSPLFELEKVKTPTLIFHGSEDRAVPRDQGWEYYRALQQVGQTPVRFLWFPGQPHGLGKLTHQMRKVEEEMDWFATYFWGGKKPENEAFKKGSPLATLLTQQKLARHNGMMGVMANKVLLPQLDTVKTDSIAIGIFEVTNAQYQQFKPGHSFALDQYNHPVTGLSREDVQAYLAWYSEETGMEARLPSAAEAEALHALACKKADGENTLRHWAGYAITVDEVPMFLAKVAEAELSLLQPVGQHSPTKVGEASVYDLGGNAAEYAQEDAHYGYSAYSFYDAADAEPAAEQDKAMGFRIVVDLN